MNLDAVGVVLRKFKKTEFPTLLERWSFAEYLRDTDVSGSKQKTVKLLAEACLENNIEEEDLAEADLIHRQLHVDSKRWTAFRIINKTGSARDEAQLNIPEVLEDKLNTQLLQFYDNSVCAVCLKDSVWLRVAILEGMPSVYYLIYHPHSSLLLATNIKRIHQQFVFYSFLRVVCGSKLKELKLQGKQAQSLADLVLHRRSQGRFSSLRFNQKDSGVLVRRKRRKRPIRVVHPYIVKEDEDIDKKRSKFVKETFGDNRLPVVDTVNFKVESRLLPNNHCGYCGPLSSHFQFQGSSVLNGIQALVEEGLTDTPLPPFLSELHTSAQSYFVIREKKRVEDTR